MTAPPHRPWPTAETATANSVHIMPMTLRTEIESLIVEFDHFAYDGAPLDVAVEKLREVLAKSAPRVLTTLEELDSEEAFTALCIMPSGGPLRVAVSRKDGVNTWQEPGYDDEYTSAELLAHFANIGDEPAFTLISAA